MKKIITVILTVLLLTASLAACAGSSNTGDTTTQSAAPTFSLTQSDTQTSAEIQASADDSADNANDSADAAYTGGYENGILDTAEMFSNRDLTQEADTSDAQTLTLTDGKDVTVTQEGVYLIKGTAANASVIVDAADDAKVQLILDGVSIANESAPAIYVRNADKVFITTASGSENTLTVSGSFTADGDTNTDAVIFSKDDLVFNGKGTLTISSTGNGVSSKDDIKITGGSFIITSTADAIEANDSIVMSDGNITINSGKDGMHAENDEDNSTGYIYIGGGSVDVKAASDGIQATTVLQIDGGNITTDSSEGLEATYIQINGGVINVTASDDGINASNKSGSYNVTAEFNGGEITISMGQGDTDAVDVNGSLYIRGGTFNITAQSAFDYDGTCEFTGGTVYVNGEQITEITNQMMGPGGMDGPNGMNGGMGGPGRF